MSPLIYSPLPRLRRACLALLVLCTTLLAATGVQAQTVYPPDPQDGTSYRAIVFHDIRQNIKESFATDPEDAAVDQSILIDFFAWLRHNQYQPVSVQQILDAKAGRKPLPPRAVLITFDDGYRSFYEKVYPLLKSNGYPAVLAVVTSWMETPDDGKVLYGSKLRPRADFISWKQAKEMVQSGLVEIASHSHDLHRGQMANPQGNLLPAAVSRQYDPKTRSYESNDTYAQRIDRDLKRSHDLIAQRTGQRPRTMVWPYGVYNAVTQEAASKAGFTVMATLGDGPNDVNSSLTSMQRGYASYDMDIATYAAMLRMPRPTVDNMASQRVMHVDLDYVYDSDPAQQERNLSALIDRVHAIGPRTVFLQAYSDPFGKGEASALYFPNRHLPMRADLFNRVSWQLRTRAGVEVYAWMPVMAFLPAKGDPVASRLVQIHRKGERAANVVPGDTRYQRLTPFDPAVRQWVRDIYEDLGRSARFRGLLFHDDAFLGDDEDASPAAMRVYQSWGLPADIDAIRKDKALSARWAQGKSKWLIQFTHELAAEVRKWQPDLLTARNMYAMPLIQPSAHEWMAQDYEEFLAAYDYTAVMAMPYMEKAANPDAWLADLAKRALAVPGSARRVLFELQARDWRTEKPVSDAELERQVKLLRAAGIRNIGYYPDDFLNNQPDRGVARRLFSVGESLKDRARDEREKANMPAQVAQGGRP